MSKLLKGDCLIELKKLPDNSVDSVVTDPPYELGFMGKSWDSTGIAFNPEVWAECLRVLKPGGYLLAFSGSRTYHRIAVAIEDAGFEIRDQIQWVYGSGFPKSMAIDKAIDKGQGQNRKRQLQFTEWMRSTGLTASQIDKITGTNMGGHYLTDKEQPAIATSELFEKLRPHLPEVPEEIEKLVAERSGINWADYKNRKITGEHTKPAPAQTWNKNYGQPFNLTIKEKKDEPHSDEAKQWQGWGTALKPAHEPIVMARKPLIGTVAENVLTYGVGGINIDGSRVGNNGGTKRDGKANQPNDSGWENMRGHGIAELNTGRFPANLIHDGSDEVLDLLGEAARFFYCAKASAKDRNEGLDNFQVIETQGGGGRSLKNYGEDDESQRLKKAASAYGAIKSARQNHHPTVKPTDLMRYLIKLVTPPNGTVLDPFLGSGSTAKAAELDGFNWVGCEMTAEYWPIIEARVAWAKKEKKKQDKKPKQQKLF